MNIPEILVGVMNGNEFQVTLHDVFSDEKGILEFSGKWRAYISGDKIFFTDGRKKLKIENGFTMSPEHQSPVSFTLHGVTIGVNFHWQRKENQVFTGSLRIIKEGNGITAVNVLSIEDYLVSVISSEMSATSSEELLRAHAVTSRSWLLAQMDKSKALSAGGTKYRTSHITEEEIIRWYDREDHKYYDVCADDHCQRYQGITKASSPAVKKAVQETAGQVLRYKGSVCDARFYKCCGGVTELFQNVWEPVNHPYLQRIIDSPHTHKGFNPDLTLNDAAEKWISGSPDSFCRCSDKSVLSQVLNDYDQETNDFYRWKVRYGQQELSDLVKNRLGINFGLITDIEPVERGVSGRITRLKLKGTLKTMIIGKELEIRKALSKTHLYSSCFYVEKSTESEELFFIIHGAGWGHGVGLCQIGAAVMGSKGYSYKKILSHYFKGARLEKIY
jgi:SpoIID/LytB domain protein